MNKRFVVYEEIGAGGNSHVYKARDILLNRICALKVIVMKGKKQRQNYVDTVTFVKQLSYDHVIQVLDWFCEEECLYICMPLVQGTTLLDAMKHKKTPMMEVLSWMIQIAEVLYALHHHSPHPIYYVDIKPQNMLCDRDGKVYLIDFDSIVYCEGMKVHSATKGYAPKEVYEQHRADVYSDMFSYGMSFYVLLHHCFPHPEVCAHPLDPIVHKCINENMHLRYTSFYEIVQVLQQFRKEWMVYE